MKLTYPQLEQHLTKTLAPIYIVSSDELLLVQEAAEYIRAAAKKVGFSERTFISVESDNNLKELLYSNTHSLSLFSEKRIIEFNFLGVKFTATQGKILQEYADNPAVDTLLLIRTNKIDKKTEKSAWFQALEKKSMFIPIWPIPAAQLAQWILQRAKKTGITLSRQMAELIANQSEGNLLAASQEIEKLHLLQLPSITHDTLTDSLTDNAHFDVFDLVDSVISSQHARSLRILNSLAEEGAEPTLILWALAREFRMMASMFEGIKQGATFSTLFSKWNIFEKRQASVRAFLQKHSQKKCWELLLKAASIDRMIKGAEVGNTWDSLEHLVVVVQNLL